MCSSPVPSIKSRVNHKRGFTLVEVCVGLMIVVVALSSAALVSKSSKQAYRFSVSETALERRLHTTLNRVSESLAWTGGEFLTPDPDPFLQCTDLQFQEVSYEEGAQVLGQYTRIRSELEPGESADGIDNDGDGLVDERRIVMVTDDGGPNERSVVLCNGVRNMGAGEELNGLDDDGDADVDEPGFWIERDEGVLIIHLALEGEGPSRERLVRSAQLATRMRN